MGSEIANTPAEAGFYRPMETCKFRVLLVMSPEAACFKRSWCLYELAAALDTSMVDIACTGPSAELITHGLTEEEEKREAQQPGRGVRAKLLREANFPMDLAEAGLAVQAEKSEAATEEDKARIVSSIAS
ncbi:unnamed protein product, partial [Effrenium voratum]